MPITTTDVELVTYLSHNAKVTSRVTYMSRNAKVTSHATQAGADVMQSRALEMNAVKTIAGAQQLLKLKEHIFNYLKI